MLECFKEFKEDNPDAIFFLPGDEKDQLHIEGATYKEAGEKLGGSYLGDSYHIILFKEDDDNEGIYDIDRFDAILVEPFEYMSGLIPANWYGIVAKRTTTSTSFINNVFDKLKES